MPGALSSTLRSDLLPRPTPAGRY